MTQSTTRSAGRPPAAHASGPGSPRPPTLARSLQANLSTAALYEAAIRDREGVIAADGPLVVRTGKHTGRSPKDKFIVREPSSEDKIWWGEVNQPISEEHYDRLRARLVDYLADARSVRPGLLHRGAPGPPPVAPRLHRDRLGEHLRPQPVPPARRRGPRRVRARTSRSSTSRRSRPTRRPRAPGPRRRSSSTSAGWRSSSSAPSTPARSRSRRSRS